MTTTTTTTTELDEIARRAAAAAPALAATDEQTRARWLHAIADALDAHLDELIGLAHQETSLAPSRLRGEVARTTGQARMFAEVIRDGGHLEVIIDHADPQATPARPDLRRMLVPLGPVAVFAASNFPFAFSVAGGDTVSALAVGCPVVVKAHPGHPLTSARTAEIVAAALDAAGAPRGTFALVEGFEVGVALVQHPAIRAVGFTGSTTGGRFLFDRAASRPSPIPFYGELGSLNPVVVTPAADARRGAELAASLAASFQLGAGQFCTKPGIVFVPTDSRLSAALPAHVGTDAHHLLTPGILDAFADAADELDDVEGIDVIAGSVEVAATGAPLVFSTDATTARAHPDEVFAEVFGPATVLVHYDDPAEVPDALAALEGTLTATIHAEPDDDTTELVAAATAVAGRVLFDGWPTGVAVSWSQHHGGPWPATTSVFTSVGATAVRRFQRPLVFQDAPPHALPAVLRDDADTGIPRRIDGRLVLD